jgi:hypothetical protein
MTTQIGWIITGIGVSLAAGLTGCQTSDTETSRAAQRDSLRAGQAGAARNTANCPDDVLAGDPNGDADLARLSGVVTSLSFNQPLLADLGVKVTNLEATGAAGQHSLSVLPEPATAFEATTACLKLSLLEGRFLDFAGGSIEHRGGPTLRGNDDSVSLAGFELRAGREPQSLELLTAAGESIFYGTLPHHEIDAGRGVFDLFNVDLQVTEALAARWKRPELAGQIVGALTLRADIEGWDAFAVPAAPPTCSDWSGDQDVALIQMNAIQQTFRSQGRVAITPSARLKNVGSANVPWHSRFSGTFPPYNNDQHPFLVWALYREVGGVIEMVAQSDVKHAFLTINQNCEPGACTQGHILGVGCEDVYSVGTNSGHLGPRSEIAAHAGTWAHCNEPAPNTPSHYDQVAPFCNQDNNGGTENGFAHRLVVHDTDLSVAGATYYFASWYLVRDDVNIFNNMGWRQISPSFSGSTWTFGFASNFTNGSALDAWVNPFVPPAGSANTTHEEPGAGTVQVAVKTTDLGRGFFKYVYAVHNHDFDPQVDSFSVPLAAGVTPSQLRFIDLDDSAGNNWTATVVPGDAITWTAPAGARMPWGTMFTFTFVANVAPVAGLAEVTGPGLANSVSLASIGVGSSGAAAAAR